MEDMMEDTIKPDSWAIVELMGHVALAGRVTKPGEYGGLWQIDIPEGETYRTEFFGSQSVYRIRMVSEEIARVYAPKNRVIEYDAPIVTRNEYETLAEKSREQISTLRREVARLEYRLAALPQGEIEDSEGPDHFTDEDEDDGLER